MEREYIYSFQKEDYLKMNKREKVKYIVGLSASLVGGYGFLYLSGKYGQNTEAAKMWLSLAASGICCVGSLYNFYGMFITMDEDDHIERGYTYLYTKDDLERYREKKVKPKKLTRKKQK